MSEEFLCVRCARHMKTCCQFSEIYVTKGDVQRITTHSGQTEFHEYRKPNNPVYADQDDDPIWRDHVFRADGSRRVLKKQANGDCHFLGPQGCQLPLDVRPLVCRIYPFDYTADGIKTELSKGCPTELLRPGQGLLQALDMTLEQVIPWHKQLYEELKAEPVCELV